MSASKQQPDSAVSLIMGEDRRRSRRVIIRVPVTLEMVMAGQTVSVAASTVAVNIHGAMVLCPRTFDADTTLQICNDRTRERVAARVTRAPRDSAEGYLVPVEFSEPSPTFWQISFPPVSWKPSDG